MKKIIIFMLILSLVMLCACSKGRDVPAVAEAPAAAAEAQPAAAATAPEQPETEEAEALPETEKARVKTFSLTAVLEWLNRGDQVEIIGEAKEGYEDYVIVRSGESYGLVEKQFLRFEGEEDYKERKGYIQGSTKLYTGWFRNDTETVNVGLNTEIKIIDEFEGCYLVEYKGMEYIVSSEMVASAPYAPSSGSGSSSGSSKDGGEISMPQLALFIDQRGSPKGTATVRLDGTPLIIGIFDRGEELEVIGTEGDLCRLLVFGHQAETEARFVCFDGEAAFEEFTKYTLSGAKLYSNPWLAGRGQKLQMNTELKVLEDLGDCYMVSGGELQGYITKEDLTDQRSYYSGGSDSGSGSSGWTEPAL